MKRLKALAQKVTTLPEGFKVHPRVEKVIADRRAMGEGEIPLDWGMGETLAYATLLDQGYGVRLSGQDSGTRHILAPARGAARSEPREMGFRAPGSRCSTSAPASPTSTSSTRCCPRRRCVGFEYGYSTSEPNKLVIWEAQFGDFANGAQVVVDQFIAAGEVKWGRVCGLTLLLPHGYEGQGPEHSSARPERYLQLCAEHNMQVCVPTTPAQIFHLLRRQMVRDFRKPLIVMSPKSLLRHKEAASTMEELADGHFHTVIGEHEKLVAKNVRRVVVCSGKVYYDLLAYRRENKISDIAIIRLEQQYPFPHADFRARGRKVSRCKGSRVVPGGTAESGCVVPLARVLARRHRRFAGTGLRRPADLRFTGGRLHVEASGATEAVGASTRSPRSSRLARWLPRIDTGNWGAHR